MIQRQTYVSGFIKEGLVVFVVLVLLAGGLIYYWDIGFERTAGTGEVNLANESSDTNIERRTTSAAIHGRIAVIDVVAEKGKFTPNIFEMRHIDQIAISVFAKDKDYPFVVKDSGISYIFKKGTGTEIPISTLGVGSHTFTCGTGCSGVIRIIGVNDSAGENN